MGDLFFDQSPSTDPAPPPAKRSRVGKVLIVLAVLAVLVLLALGAGAFYIKGKVDPSGGPGEEVAVDIPRGTSTAGIASLLDEKGVITDAGVFKLYLRVKGGGPFDAGLYRMPTNSAMGDVVQILEKGPALPPAFNITIPEGLVIDQVVSRVDDSEQFDGAEFRAAIESGDVRSKYSPPGQTSLEGLLFPDTYRVEESAAGDELGLLGRMVGTFDQIATEVGYDEAESKVGYSAYEAIIVASLVEAEAKDDADRAKIARVVYNRLEQGIPLGIDATFYFALPLDRRGTSLRQSDLDRPGPYNTRLNRGLVPTPIALPGRASLEAALNPEPGPWLYYVLKDQRTHAFSESYDEFLRNKRAAQENGLIP
jgi:UPF0755 protein